MAIKYNIFVSHAWSYSERYSTLISLLDKAKNNPYIDFDFKNYSVPKHDPLIDPNTIIGERKLTTLLDAQIKPCSTFLLIAGMYVDNRHWIQKEIEIAQKYNKRIIGIRRRGQKNNPTSVVQVSHDMTNWNTNSIINSIKG